MIELTAAATAPEQTLKEEPGSDLPSLQEFQHWLANAKPKAKVVYARAMWLTQRNGRDDNTPFLSAAAFAVTNAAWAAQVRGEVCLVQRRNCAGTFDYLAIKRARIEPPKSVLMRGSIRHS